MADNLASDKPALELVQDEVRHSWVGPDDRMAAGAYLMLMEQGGQALAHLVGLNDGFGSSGWSDRPLLALRAATLSVAARPKLRTALRVDVSITDLSDDRVDIALDIFDNDAEEKVATGTLGLVPQLSGRSVALPEEAKAALQRLQDSYR